MCRRVDLAVGDAMGAEFLAVVIKRLFDFLGCQFRFAIMDYLRITLQKDSQPGVREAPQKDKLSPPFRLPKENVTCISIQQQYAPFAHQELPVLCNPEAKVRVSHACHGQSDQQSTGRVFSSPDKQRF